MIQQHNPLHPGEFIRRVYMELFSLGSNELARKLKVSNGVVSRLLNNKTDVSPAMAIRLSTVVGRTPESWLMMQDNNDLYHAKQDIDIDALEAIAFPA